MKKFDRLPLESRKAEIQSAAAKLFLEKGFRATTMENVVAGVSLSKGGVYRIYPSTTAILSDIILEGMRERNRYYQQRAAEIDAENRPLSVTDIVDTICDGMLLLPEVSALYVEFLIEKRHNPELEALYQNICEETMRATGELLEHLKLPEKFKLDITLLWRITDVMNTAILGIVVLGRREDFDIYKVALESAMFAIINGDKKV